MRPGFDFPTALSTMTASPTPTAWRSSSWVSTDRRSLPPSETPRPRTSCWSTTRPSSCAMRFEYRRFSEVLLKAAGKAPSGLYSMLGLVLGRPVRFAATLLLLSLTPGRFASFRRLIRFASKRIANPLTTRYWSTTPYRFGDTCMKFSAVPADFPGGPPAEGPVDDSYEALADFLRSAAAIETVTPQDSGNSPDYLREALGANTRDARGCLPVPGSALSGRRDDSDRRPDGAMARGGRAFSHRRLDLDSPARFRYAGSNGFRRKPVVHCLACDHRS